MPNLIVANLQDGRVIKGISLDVDPSRPVCHIRTGAGMEKVRLMDTKALFFVRDLSGDARRTDRQEPDPDDLRAKGATRVDIMFRDGERIAAFTNRFPPRGAFYFVVPVDGGSNNTRILVNAAAVASITPAMLTSANASPG
jgi:hypothetical protein